MAKLVNPTGKGFEVLKLTPVTATGKEWVNTFFYSPSSVRSYDKEYTFYKLIKTGKIIKNLELICVEPIISDNTIRGIECFQHNEICEIYKKIIKIADQNQLPFAALSKQTILIDKKYQNNCNQFIYLAQFYRQRENTN